MLLTIIKTSSNSQLHMLQTFNIFASKIGWYGVAKLVIFFNDKIKIRIRAVNKIYFWEYYSTTIFDIIV